MLGTVYMIDYDGQIYSQKIQHILENQKEQNLKYSIWREIDLYKYIKTLDNEDKKFFISLYDYKIYDNCEHKQIRPYAITPIIKELDNSKWCITHIIDYKGDKNLEDFLGENKITEKMVYSFCLQICKMIQILYNGGYSHNDLHPGNIMINKTNDEYFNFMDKKISYEGYQLTAIDYGSVIHKKFLGSDISKKFLYNRDEWLFKETFYTTMYVIDGLSRNIKDCKDLKKPLPWELKISEEAIMKILLNHPDFYNKVKGKYFNLFPKGKELVELVFKKIHKNESYFDIIKNDKNKYYYQQIMKRINYEFQAVYPEDFTKYWNWCSVHHSLIPLKTLQKILTFDDFNNYCTFLIGQIDNKK